MIFRAEHPDPQFERGEWINLNGVWQFETDRADSGEARKMNLSEYEFHSQINVPFCPQSKLSGVEDTDFMVAVWYRRGFFITEEQAQKKTVLRFGASDYETTVYINGCECGKHIGGYTSFSFDISSFITPGENTVTVRVRDDERNPMIPCGKQSDSYGSYGCLYTRTTGIWQTVWLEFLPLCHIENVRYYPDAENCSLTVSAQLCGMAELCVDVFYEGRSVGHCRRACSGTHTVFTVALTEKHLWEVGQGRLYDVCLTYGDDSVKSYFGMRSIDYHNRRFYLNGRAVFQRLILDQGFYPEGIYTAPSDAELEADITRSMSMGFNGARLHQKVFEPRFLYHCDRKGYLVWGEYPSWGLDHTRPDSVYGMLGEWLEEIDRDFNHPSIVGWCPFNETWDIKGRQQYDDVLRVVYQATKAADSTRPCIDTSGNYHVVTDIYDVHNYEQDPERFAEHYKNLAADGSHFDTCGKRQKYDGKAPFFVSEYGGIRWTDDEDGWGYGNAPRTEKEFLERLRGLTDVLLDCSAMFGFCYTQLTDVEQEQNGLYTYDRKPKFDPGVICSIISRKAASED